MAIAITDFEALCDFVPPEELAEAVSSVPELRDCIGDAPAAALQKLGKNGGLAAGADKEALKEAFSALMTCPPKKVCPKHESYSLQEGGSMHLGCVLCSLML